MRFAKDFPDELIDQIQISDIVSKKVALKKKGKEFGGLCPFHNEKTPSFTVNDQKGFYHCFGCGAHGNAINFVMQTDGLDFKEAVIRLAENNGISIPYIKEEFSESDIEKQEEIKKEYLLLEKACQFFENNLWEYTGNRALDYLKKRGLNEKNIKKLRLGFTLDNFDSLINFLKQENFSEKDLLESGIISKNENGKLYDKFRSRIIFPITDKKGKIIAFGGRSLGDEQPKYLNSAETKIFKKGSNLYNYFSARKAIFEEKCAVIVEGYMDVISLAINGIENTVAPLGTALTEDQLKELFRITSDVIICLDGDQAGIRAMRRAIDTALPLISAKNIIRFAFLPNKMDPDDFIKSSGRKAMKDLLINAKNLSEILFDFEIKDLEISPNFILTPEIKIQLENNLNKKVNLISDANIKKHFFGYYKDRLFNLGRNKINSSKNISNKNKTNLTSNSTNSENFSLEIILLLINFPELINYKDEFCNIRELHLETEELSNIKDSIIEFTDHNNYSKEELLNYLKKNFSLKEVKNNFKNDFFGKKLSYNLDYAKLRIEILALRFYLEKINSQYTEILFRDDVETDCRKILDGKQKEIFEYKTRLEKKILQLEN